METYFVEGVYNKKRSNVKSPGRGVPAGGAEPYAKAIWAQDEYEAVRIATQELGGGEWVEGPDVSKTSEEQHMRELGAPQLPGFGPSKGVRRYP